MLKDRSIEPQPLAQRLDIGGGGVGTEHHGSRVARCHPDDDKDNGHDDGHHNCHADQSVERSAKHVSTFQKRREGKDGHAGKDWQWDIAGYPSLRDLLRAPPLSGGQAKTAPLGGLLILRARHSRNRAMARGSCLQVQAIGLQQH